MAETSGIDVRGVLSFEKSDPAEAMVMSTALADAPARIDIRVLGPLEARIGDGVALALGGPRQRTLLGLLALRAPGVVSTDRLVDGIWGDAPPPSALRTLHAHLAYLRRRLADAGASGLILTRPPGYALVIDPEQVDARRFEQLVTQGRAALHSGAWPEAAARLGQASRLWRGDVLADCPIGEWARAEAVALGEARLYAIEDRLAAELELGEHARVVAELGTLLAEEPLRERFWELLMTAQYSGGRAGDALATARRARTVFIAELGLPPGGTLRRA